MINISRKNSLQCIFLDEVLENVLSTHNDHSSFVDSLEIKMPIKNNLDKAHLVFKKNFENIGNHYSIDLHEDIEKKRTDADKIDVKPWLVGILVVEVNIIWDNKDQINWNQNIQYFPD